MGRRSGHRLAALMARFDEWRQGPRRRRIPEALWGAAVRAARQHGVWQTSRELKLDYSALKRRVMTTARQGRQSAPMKFVDQAGFLNDHVPDIAALQDKPSDPDLKKPDLKK